MKTMNISDLVSEDQSLVNDGDDGKSLLWAFIKWILEFMWDLFLRLNIWIQVFFFYMVVVHVVLPWLFWLLVLILDSLFPCFNFCFPIKALWKLTDTKGTRDKLGRELAKIKVGVWTNPEDSDEETRYAPFPEEQQLMTELSHELTTLVQL